MKHIKTLKKICMQCMQDHEVDIFEIAEKTRFKSEEVMFKAIYEYCSHTDEFLETEDLIKKNDLSMKDAYRSKLGFLTSQDIIDIRNKYSVSQKDFSKILGWGRATITRYENHQVQDRAHDDVLRKISLDPKWFLEMLQRSEGSISKKAYNKYKTKARCQYKKSKNEYLISSIYAEYADIQADLNLNKVVDMINFLAQKVGNLRKSKLMQLLWYSDYLYYQTHGCFISGLVYYSTVDGFKPKGFDLIIELDGVSYSSTLHDQSVSYVFSTFPNFVTTQLERAEVEMLNCVVEDLEGLTFSQLVEKISDINLYDYENTIVSYLVAEEGFKY